ncbi:MAG: efflux RND transporter periplasmic adaptor subunit [Bacteroidales bacterium]|jgi:RND family efflux transporter MFP subunit|nr:efflux RND transporter periplasmic adaptor subunit [Bacteroidales bacterium]MDD4085626.1 efflux RND transporter periplasmic adaptor subunit [Bacteroidales bacterium]
MKTFKIIATIFVFSILSACSTEETAETISKQLESLRKEQRELAQKITDTEQKLKALSKNEDTRQKEAVVLQQITPRTFNHFFETSGSVEAVEEAFISPEVNGQIKKILVVEGDRVKKGQLLAELNTDIIERNIAEIETALVLAKDVYERQKRLWEQKIGSEVQFLEARNNKENLENKLQTLQAQLDLASITAPIDGIVEKVYQKNGELAVPGVQLIHLVNLNELKVRADVSEAYLPVIHSNDSVNLTFPSFPDYKKSLTISRVGNVVNKNNRTFEIEVRVKNENEILKPNMIAVITINDYTAKNSMIVPSKVIREDLNGRYLYVAEWQGDDLVSRKRYISIGRTYGNETRVLDGLKMGDKVITEGFNRITDGSLLRE